MAKCPFRAISPPPWMPLWRDSPLLPWKASGTLGGTHFWQPLRGGGVPKFYGDSKGGGYAFFTDTFPEKDHPQPPTRNSEQSLSALHLIWPCLLGTCFCKTEVKLSHPSIHGHSKYSESGAEWASLHKVPFTSPCKHGDPIKQAKSCEIMRSITLIWCRKSLTARILFWPGRILNYPFNNQSSQ